MVIDRKRGQNVWRETWAGGKLMEGEHMRERERERTVERCNMVREKSRKNELLQTVGHGEDARI